MSATYTVTLGNKGRLVVPAEIRAQHGLSEGTPLLLVASHDGLVVMTRDQARARLRRSLAGPSLVDELIAERRTEAARDQAERP